MELPLVSTLVSVAVFAQSEPIIAQPEFVQVSQPLLQERPVEQPTRVAFRIIAICVSAIAVSVNLSNYGPLIPLLRSTLHVDDGQVGLFSTLFFLGIVLSNIPGGILVDRLGARKMMLGALSLVVGSSLLLPIFPNFIWMVGCRALLGFGAGASLVSCSYASAQLGKHEPVAQGLNGGAAQLGMALGLFLMPQLLGILGLRGALFACGFPGVAALLLWLWFPKKERSTAGVVQPRENPLVAMRTPAILQLGLANMGTFGLADAITAWISVYFITRYGLPLTVAGMLAGLALLTGVIFQPLGGILLSRWQRPLLLIRVGTLLSLLSVIVLALPVHAFPLAIIGLVLLVIGTTLPYAAIFSSAATVGKKSGAGSGVSQGIVALFAASAGVAGAPLIGLVLERSGSFSVSLGTAGLIFPTVAIISSLSLGRVFGIARSKKSLLAVQ